MKKSERIMVNEFITEYIDINKTFVKQLKLLGDNSVIAYKAYAISQSKLGKKYAKIRPYLLGEFNKEKARAEKTGDYSRLIYMPLVPGCELPKEDVLPKV